MKAIVYQSFGSPDVLKCEEIEKPLPGNTEVLIKVRASSVNPLDWKLMEGGPILLRLVLGPVKPKIKRPGVDVAGEVEAVGATVTQFKPGDQVFGTCVGAFAEYATSHSAMGLKSASVILTALQGLRDKGQIQLGQKVLVNGAAGGVGTFAVQIAKSFGAHVTGVCSARNVEMVRSIGADEAIDYTQQDFTRGGQHYDLVLDCVGSSRAPHDVRLLRILARVVGAIVLSRFGSQKMVFFIARINQQDLTTVGEFMATGKVTPVIDRCYRLSETREAFEYMEEGHARGKVIITTM